MMRRSNWYCKRPHTNQVGFEINYRCSGKRILAGVLFGVGIAIRIQITDLFGSRHPLLVSYEALGQEIQIPFRPILHSTLHFSTAHCIFPGEFPPLHGHTL